MENKKATANTIILVASALLLTVLFVFGLARADWMKMDPPPDVDWLECTDPCDPYYNW